MSIYTYFKHKYLLKKNNAFIWDPKKGKFNRILNVKSIPLNLLKAIESQKNTLKKNTVNFANNNVTNNALLWGARGNGKSTLIKSIFNELIVEFNNLRLVQLNKQDILLEKQKRYV